MREPSTTAKPLVGRPQFVIQDFCKMFVGALVCGLVFSLIATGVTLTLVNLSGSIEQVAVVTTGAN